MNFIWGLTVGVAVSVIVCLIWLKTKKPVEVSPEPPPPKRDLIAETKERHAENIAKIKAYLVGKTEVANDEVQNLLGVSDATAERYLNELEEEGEFEQIGKIGHQVKYKVNGSTSNAVSH